MEYVYFGSSDDLEELNYTKIGMCENVKSRMDTYKTSSPYYGFKPYAILKCELKDAKLIEENLHIAFMADSLYHNNRDKQDNDYNGGLEWFNAKYNKDDIIEALFDTTYKYEIIEGELLDKFIIEEKRINRENKEKIYKKCNKEYKKRKKLKSKPKPNNIQQKILDLMYFDNNNEGYYNLPCGLGKTLLSLFQAQYLNAKNILIGVPSLNLVEQFSDEVKKLYSTKYILTISSHEDSTLSSEEISDFLKSDYAYKIIIVTYHSSRLVKQICENNKIIFDFKIGDEAHHLVGSIYKNNSNSSNSINSSKIESSDKIINSGGEVRSFKEFVFIKSKKTLYMTATPKLAIMDNQGNYFSMDDEKIFGKLIYKKSVKWAIENDYITDYYINFIKNTEEQTDNIIKLIKIKVENKELFLSAYMALKSLREFDNLTHLLIYTNTTANSDLINKYIKHILLKNLVDISNDEIYHKSLHSNLNKDKFVSSSRNKSCFNLKNEVKSFKKKKYGIIACVQIFGEGFNEPMLNGIVVAEKMESEIRIIQSVLRPHRKEKGNANKIAYIICPFIDSSISDDRSNFSKIQQITKHLRNVDDNLVSRMKLYDCKKRKIPHPNIPKLETQVELTENENALNTLKFRLRHSKALKSGLSEEEDYYKMLQSKNKELNIQNRKEYVESEKYNNEYIKNPDNYFKKHILWKNWYEFLGVDTSHFIQEKEEWVRFCNENKIKDLDVYYEYCEKYKQLPKDPEEFYDDFSFIRELDISTRVRR